MRLSVCASVRPVSTSIVQTTCKNAAIIDVTSRLPSKVNVFCHLLRFRCGVASLF